MTSKLPLQKFPKKIFKSYLKFVFMTKKFKQKKTNVMFLRLLLNAMSRNIKIHNIFDIIEMSKYMKPDKCTN
jgi:hypothetical protein